VVHLTYDCYGCRWKSKCTKLETEVERLTKSSETATSRCDQLAKELETASSQSGTRQQQVEHMRRELNDLLVSACAPDNSKVHVC
jgi:chromosome segregation ATPase